VKASPLPFLGEALNRIDRNEALRAELEEILLLLSIAFARGAVFSSPVFWSWLYAI
jgi:hypothetical protein